MSLAKLAKYAARVYVENDISSYDREQLRELDEEFYKVGAALGDIRDSLLTMSRNSESLARKFRQPHGTGALVKSLNAEIFDLDKQLQTVSAAHSRVAKAILALK